MSSNEPLDHQASCLACANCGQVLALSSALLSGNLDTRPNAVFSYPLTTLGVPTLCFSATRHDGLRFDLLRFSELCLRSRTQGPGTVTRRRQRGRKAAGVLPLGAYSPKEAQSWFPGYLWQPLTCGSCQEPELLGWSFVSSDSRATGFFGLIATKLCERSCREDLGAACLTVEELHRNYQPGVVAAARGLSSMPLCVLPSTREVGGQPHLRRLPVAVPFDDRSPCRNSPSSDGGDSADFKLQRRSMRLASLSHRAKRLQEVARRQRLDSRALPTYRR